MTKAHIKLILILTVLAACIYDSAFIGLTLVMIAIGLGLSIYSDHLAVKAAERERTIYEVDGQKYIF